MTDLPWEDNLVERKVNPNAKDMIRTIVAFANSVMPGRTAKFYIGERDDGTADGVDNPDRTQMAVREACDKIYPPITNTCRSRVYEKDRKPCVCVEIVYDGDTPHFAGKAFVRRGSQTKEASDEVFQKLIELRLNKVRELAKWIDKGVTFEIDRRVRSANLGVTYEKFFRRSHSQNKATLLEVNSFWVKLHLYSLNTNHSVPLENTTLNWDDDNNCLKLIINP